jgi:Family of unknown function (DUF6338)
MRGAGARMMNLNVSSLFFEIALILIPGFIWMKIHTKYGARGELTQFDMILNAFMFGVIAYGVLYLIDWQCNLKMSILTIDADVKKLFQPEVFIDIISATLVAVLLSVVHLYGEKYKLFSRFVQKIGATKAYGDEDVWDFVFNSSDPSVNYVHFRDFENQVVYAGWAVVFSGSGKLRELVLSQVRVHDFEGNFMYEVPGMYLARERDSIHIEFPQKG